MVDVRLRTRASTPQTYATKVGQYFEPSKLGIALVASYEALGLQLHKPTLRSIMEVRLYCVRWPEWGVASTDLDACLRERCAMYWRQRDCKAICENKKTREAVVSDALGGMKEVRNTAVLSTLHCVRPFVVRLASIGNSHSYRLNSIVPPDIPGFGQQGRCPRRCHGPIF
jgi:hypothetical protein